MVRLDNDTFRIFISHKHENAALAELTKAEVERLIPQTQSRPKRIACFVSGQDIHVGSNWERRIKRELERSHLLLLLFTNPSRKWDWCLFETGLFARFSEEDIHAIACVYPPTEGPPGPLGAVQGVPAIREKLEQFLSRLCIETYELSDDWRVGPLAPRGTKALSKRIEKAAGQIEEGFKEALMPAASLYYPCHRVVLDLREKDTSQGIPEDAVVLEGYGKTSAYTLPIFQRSEGPAVLTWGAMLDGVDGRNSAWHRELDDQFKKALADIPFPPTTGTFEGWSPDQRNRRIYKPVLYRIEYEGPKSGQVPVGCTILIDRLLAPSQVGGPAFNLVRINARYRTEVFDEYLGQISVLQDSRSDVFGAVRDAFHLIDYEAAEYGVFDSSTVEDIYGDRYEKIQLLEHAWLEARDRLDTAIARRSVEEAETALNQLSDLNRSFSIEATRRYLRTLETSAGVLL